MGYSFFCFVCCFIRVFRLVLDCSRVAVGLFRDFGRLVGFFGVCFFGFESVEVIGF